MPGRTLNSAKNQPYRHSATFSHNPTQHKHIKIPQAPSGIPMPGGAFFSVRVGIAVPGVVFAAGERLVRPADLGQYSPEPQTCLPAFQVPAGLRASAHRCQQPSFFRSSYLPINRWSSGKITCFLWIMISDSGLTAPNLRSSSV